MSPKPNPAMKKVGQILREERLKQDKSLEDISQITRVRAEFIEAIENGTYDQLPNPIYTRGFISSYAKALGLDETKVLPFYRREVELNKTTDVKRIPTPIVGGRLNFTPGKFAVLVVSIAVTVFLAVLFIQYRNFAGVPLLLIDFPPNNYTTDQTSIQVAGRTDPQAVVTVNGESANVELTGYFQITFHLIEGINRIKVIAESEIGRQNIIERIVERKL